MPNGRRGNDEEGRHRQREYYRATAADYDHAHASEVEHDLALDHIGVYCARLGATSVLDTGCGTGRGLRYFRERFPELRVHGNDPSAELLEQSGLPGELLDCVGSERLPYADGEFDVVLELGVLHHVPRPDLVVAEMLRVARLAVFLSDSNIYGQGAPAARFVKYGLARAGLLRPLNRLRRGGKDWFYSEGDGVAFSYSVFDSYRQLSAACERVTAIPLDGSGRTTLFSSPHVLLCGFKGAAGLG